MSNCYLILILFYTLFIAGLFIAGPAKHDMYYDNDHVKLPNLTSLMKLQNQQTRGNTKDNKRTIFKPKISGNNGNYRNSFAFEINSANSAKKRSTIRTKLSQPHQIEEVYNYIDSTDSITSDWIEYFYQGEQAFHPTWNKNVYQLYQQKQQMLQNRLDEIGPNEMTKIQENDAWRQWLLHTTTKKHNKHWSDRPGALVLQERNHNRTVAIVKTERGWNLQPVTMTAYIGQVYFPIYYEFCNSVIPGIADRAGLKNVHVAVDAYHRPPSTTGTQFNFYTQWFDNSSAYDEMFSGNILIGNKPGFRIFNLQQIAFIMLMDYVFFNSDRMNRYLHRVSRSVPNNFNAKAWNDGNILFQRINFGFGDEFEFPFIQIVDNSLLDAFYCGGWKIDEPGGWVDGFQKTMSSYESLKEFFKSSITSQFNHHSVNVKNNAIIPLKYIDTPYKVDIIADIMTRTIVKHGNILFNEKSIDLLFSAWSRAKYLFLGIRKFKKRSDPNADELGYVTEVANPIGNVDEDIRNNTHFLLIKNMIDFGRNRLQFFHYSKNISHKLNASFAMMHLSDYILAMEQSESFNDSSEANSSNQLDKMAIIDRLIPKKREQK